NPRSTVATATEIYDHFRVLFARVGRTYCLKCGQEVKKDTVDEVTDAVLALGDGARLNALFPLRVALSTSTTNEVAGGKKNRGGVPPRSKAQRQQGSKPNASPTIDDSLRARLFELRQRGFNRLYQDGQIFEFSTPESLLDINF